MPCCALSGHWELGVTVTQGGAALCPGLTCCAPSGQEDAQKMPCTAEAGVFASGISVKAEIRAKLLSARSGGLKLALWYYQPLAKPTRPHPARSGEP